LGRFQPISSAAKYSLRTLMIAVTLFCGALGFVFAFVNYERGRIRYKWEACNMLHAKGIQLGGRWPKPLEQMQTWRGNETIDYTDICTICGGKERMTADDVRTLVATFPNIVDVEVMNCELTEEQLRHLVMLPRLKKLTLFRVPVEAKRSSGSKENIPR
jgi:hypothetical protein